MGKIFKDTRPSVFGLNMLTLLWKKLLVAFKQEKHYTNLHP
jgi:hypothetical protein